MSPEQLHLDLSTVGQWLAEMGGARTTTSTGLVHLDMQALQRLALPAIAKAHRCAQGGVRVCVCVHGARYFAVCSVGGHPRARGYQRPPCMSTSSTALMAPV